MNLIENKIEILVENLKHEIRNESNELLSIYVYGSYIRGDFIKNHSDIDFALILNCKDKTNHWEHPIFVKVENTIIEIFSDIKTIFRKQFHFDIISFSLREFEKASQNQITDIIGPLSRITFFAKDFCTYNRLLWGQDIITLYKDRLTKYPPSIFAEGRLIWMKNIFKKNILNVDNCSFYSLLNSLGSVIRHFAVLDGVEIISKNHLHIWVNSGDFFKDEDKKVILNPYFKFINHSLDEEEVNNNYWKFKVKKLIAKALKIK